MSSSLNQLPEGMSDLLKTKGFEVISKKIIELMSNPEASELITGLIKSIDYKKMLIAQGLLVLFMLVFRSYIFTKFKSFWSRLIGEIWSLAIYVSMSCFFIPLFVIGFEYLDLIKILFRTFL